MKNITKFKSKHLNDIHNKLNYYLLCVAILAPGIVNLEDAEKAFYGRRYLTNKESVVTTTGAILLKLRNKGLTYKAKYTVLRPMLFITVSGDTQAG